MKTIKLIAPAKVNLFLGIGARREDGYHDATTVMHALAMHDTMQMYLVESGEDVSILEQNDPAQPLRQAVVRVEPGQGLQVSARNLWFNGIEPLDIPSEDNLACKAVQVLAEELNRSEDETVRIVIEKHIPYQAGLGGGSSNAAAALLGIAFMWGIAADDPAVERAARRLGADVCFFLHGGCTLLEGRGDILKRKLGTRKDTVVIIRPDGGVSTKRAYELFDEDPQLFDSSIMEQVESAENAVDVPLGNNLEAPAGEILPAIGEVRDFVRERVGDDGLLLCGSGSAVFVICDDYVRAQNLATDASRSGYWARVTTFSGIRAAVLPAVRWR